MTTEKTVSSKYARERKTRKVLSVREAEEGQEFVCVWCNGRMKLNKYYPERNAYAKKFTEESNNFSHVNGSCVYQAPYKYETFWHDEAERILLDHLEILIPKKTYISKEEEYLFASEVKKQQVIHLPNQEGTIIPDIVYYNKEGNPILLVELMVDLQQRIRQIEDEIRQIEKTQNTLF